MDLGEFRKRQRKGDLLIQEWQAFLDWLFTLYITGEDSDVKKDLDRFMRDPTDPVRSIVVTILRTALKNHPALSIGMVFRMLTALPHNIPLQHLAKRLDDYKVRLNVTIVTPAAWPDLPCMLRFKYPDDNTLVIENFCAA